MTTVAADKDPGNGDKKTTPPLKPSAAAKAVSVFSKKPTCACFQDMVTIEVGPERKRFGMHKDLLCFYSDYFRGAFNGSFKEAVEGKLSLLDEKVTIFELFNAFVYTRELRDTDDRVSVDLTFRTLFELWVFGDKYMAPSLQNMAIDTFAKKNAREKRIPIELVHDIYDKTLPGSPMRSLIIDISAYKGKLSEFMIAPLVSNWTNESLTDLVLTLYKKKKEHVGVYQLPKKRGKCYYHIHNEGEGCE